MQRYYIIETERLNLIQITPAIIRTLFNEESKEAIMNLFGCDESYYLRLLSMYEKGIETDRISLRMFLLQNKSTGITMGECGFHTWNATHRRSDVYYFLNQDSYKRQGFMKEALHAVLKHGFEEMNLHRVAGFIDDNNLPSKRLLEHYGFQREGVMREDYVVNGVNEDSVCYSLLKWEWEKRSTYNA